MPSVTRGAKKDSSDGSPHSAHADVPLAIAGTFDDGNANADGAADHGDPNGANISAAEEPRMGAGEGPGRYGKMGTILETQLKAMEVALEKSLKATIAQMSPEGGGDAQKTREGDRRL